MNGISAGDPWSIFFSNHKHHNPEKGGHSSMVLYFFVLPKPLKKWIESVIVEAGETQSKQKNSKVAILKLTGHFSMLWKWLWPRTLKTHEMDIRGCSCLGPLSFYKIFVKVEKGNKLFVHWIYLLQTIWKRNLSFSNQIL